MVPGGERREFRNYAEIGGKKKTILPNSMPQEKKGGTVPLIYTIKGKGRWKKKTGYLQMGING